MHSDNITIPSIPNTISIHINIPNWTIRPILIRRHRMILFSKSVICRKPPQRRIIMPRPIIIPVQPLLRIKLLAVILVRLHIA